MLEEESGAPVGIETAAEEAGEAGEMSETKLAAEPASVSASVGEVRKPNEDNKRGDAVVWEEMTGVEAETIDVEPMWMLISR